MHDFASLARTGISPASPFLRMF